ncbi:MAG: cyclic pyranopterin monophosphate synthase MoaC [Thermoanaerobaculum sp.]
MHELTHLDRQGRIRMVDVGEKPPTQRRAVAAGTLVLGPDIARALQEGRTPKGNALEAARLSGIAAAKRTWELIPLCHQIPLDHVQVEFELLEDRVEIRAEAKAFAKTGVEMEALTAVAMAGLALYDMLKALGKTMALTNVRLLEKEGGKSGRFVREENHER